MKSDEEAYKQGKIVKFSIWHNGLWHDVCLKCQPDMKMSICGTLLTSQSPIPSESLEGLDCIVCSHMVCPTCPEEGTTT